MKRLKTRHVILAVLLAIIVYKIVTAPKTPDHDYVLKLPHSFTIEEKLNLFYNNFNVKANDTSYGSIEQHWNILDVGFTYIDKNNYKAGEASNVLWSIGNKSEIYDYTGKAIGSVEEKIFDSLLPWKNTYEVKNANGKTVATSEKLQGWSATFTLKRNGRVVAKIQQELGWLFDDWHVEIYDESIDPRLVMFIACFKSTADSSE